MAMRTGRSLQNDKGQSDLGKWVLTLRTETEPHCNLTYPLLSMYTSYACIDDL